MTLVVSASSVSPRGVLLLCLQVFRHVSTSHIYSPTTQCRDFRTDRIYSFMLVPDHTEVVKIYKDHWSSDAIGKALEIPCICIFSLMTGEILNFPLCSNSCIPVYWGVRNTSTNSLEKKQQRKVSRAVMCEEQRSYANPHVETLHTCVTAEQKKSLKWIQRKKNRDLSATKGVTL